MIKSVEQTKYCDHCGCTFFVRGLNGDQCKVCGCVRTGVAPVRRALPPDGIKDSIVRTAEDPFGKLSQTDGDIIELTEAMEIKDEIVLLLCDNTDCLAHIVFNTYKLPDMNQHVYPCRRCGGIMFRRE